MMPNGLANHSGVNDSNGGGREFSHESSGGRLALRSLAGSSTTASSPALQHRQKRTPNFCYLLEESRVPSQGWQPKAYREAPTPSSSVVSVSSRCSTKSSCRSPKALEVVVAPGVESS